MDQRQAGPPGKQQAGHPPSEPAQAGPPAPGAAPSWGQGSATALEHLRQRNYRGRRSKPAGERPAAE